jgi:hypothetical protein
MVFEQNIQSWVTLDNEIKKMNDKLKGLREQRNDLSNDILIYIKDNSLDNATIKISDGRLRFMNVKQQSPLTYKFIQECLLKSIKNEEQVEALMTFIKEQRESKVQTEIKRNYNE